MKLTKGEFSIGPELGVLQFRGPIIAYDDPLQSIDS